MWNENRGMRSASLLVLLLLTACGGSPSRVEVTPAIDAALPTPGPSRKPSVVQKRGGAYYKDDGPGDDIPDNLDELPDARPQPEPLHRFANRPYVVLGKSYTPNTQVKPFRQRGIASWYGKKFHGQKTSIGEPYDMFSMTAAHPTLAIPSYVRITRVGSGKSVVVRVTDRGPFHADRIIDLSYAAAYRLGYVKDGSALVEVEAVLASDAPSPAYALAQAPENTVKPLPAETARDEIEILANRLAGNGTEKAATQMPSAQPGVYLQLGAFSNADNAESLRMHLLRELDWLNQGIHLNFRNGVHRVHLGPYANRAEADRVAEKIRLALGYKPVFATP